MLYGDLNPFKAQIYLGIGIAAFSDFDQFAHEAYAAMVPMEFRRFVIVTS